MKTFTLKNFELQCETVLPEAEIIYETYGKLAGDSSSDQFSCHEDLFSKNRGWECAVAFYGNWGVTPLLQHSY